MGELGRLFGLSRTALLYYDSIGLLKPSGRSASGYRRYGESGFRRIHASLERTSPEERRRLLGALGFSASGTGDFLRELGGGGE